MTPNELLEAASRALRGHHFGGKSAEESAEDICGAAAAYLAQVHRGSSGPPRATQACTKCGASFPSGCCDCEAGDDCPLCGDCCDAALAYCTDCDSPCEGGECDPPHLCRKHGACPKCNP